MALYLTTQPLLWVVTDVPPVPSHISIQTQKGVTAFDAQIAQRAVAFSMQEIEKKLGLMLTHSVTVLLTPDAKTYAQVLRDEEGVKQEAALAQAALTSGSTHGDRVIINIGEIESYNDAMFIVAHEIAHQSQLEALADSTRLNWLTEGMADWIASQTVAANMGELPNSASSQVSRYQHSWLMTVAQSPLYPHLKDLDGRTEWLNSIYVYGPVVPYRTAALAFFRLAELAGIDSFRYYFALRAKGESVEPAFSKAFGMTLDVFEANYTDWLQASLRKIPRESSSSRTEN
jgi:hypothetical protein